MDEFFNTDEAAEYLRKAPATLNRWRGARVGPAFFKVGGAITYRRADLDAFVSASRIETTHGRIERVVRAAAS